MDAGEGLLDVKAMASELQKSEQTVRALCRSGVIPAVKLGRSWFIPRSRFRALFDEGVEDEQRKQQHSAL